MNYQRVLDEVGSAAERAGRASKEITLVAVSKGNADAAIRTVYDAGCRDFGENRIQEVLPKIQSSPQDIRWHFIGSLQANKVRKAINTFFLIHSVDSLGLAQKISDCSPKPQPILLQVNTSGEQTKHGLDEAAWFAVFEQLLQLPGIEIKGLMTMAPFQTDEKQVRRCFSSLRIFKEKLSQFLPLPHLSMGMSQDYHLAIQEGATILRIGSAIFKN